VSLFFRTNFEEGGKFVHPTHTHTHTHRLCTDVYTPHLSDIRSGFRTVANFLALG
jgi:hypothetical protein